MTPIRRCLPLLSRLFLTLRHPSPPLRPYLYNDDAYPSSTYSWTPHILSYDTQINPSFRGVYFLAYPPLRQWHVPLLSRGYFFLLVSPPIASTTTSTYSWTPQILSYDTQSLSYDDAGPFFGVLATLFRDFDIIFWVMKLPSEEFFF